MLLKKNPKQHTLYRWRSIKDEYSLHGRYDLRDFKRIYEPKYLRKSVNECKHCWETSKRENIHV